MKYLLSITLSILLLVVQFDCGTSSKTSSSPSLPILSDTVIRPETRRIAHNAAKPWFVSAYMHAYKERQAYINHRVQTIVNNLTTVQKAKQIDQYYGNAEFLSFGNINWTAVTNEFANDGVGIIHDLYAPGNNADNGTSIINQLQQYILTNTDPKIPILFVEECLHGVQQSAKTVFPAPIASSASFDRSLMYEIGSTIGKEARAYGIVQCFAPVIGTSREPRWGRTVETFGEDVFLTSTHALMYVLGAQGGDPSGASLNSSSSIISEPKHYLAHSAPQSGTNTAPVHAGLREMFESYAPQFEWAVRYGGARGIMSAYSELDGIPCTNNNYTLNTLLREQWGFQGWVLSDDGAVKMTEVTHYTSSYPAEAITQFISAGGNSQYYDYPHSLWDQAIVDSIGNGTLATVDLDARVTEVIRVKMELGLFDNPFTDTSLIQSNVNTEQAKQLALLAARECLVLLQNNNTAVNLPIDETTTVQSMASAPLLPLDLVKKYRTVAIIGPSADVIRVGDYSGLGVSENFVTILEGMQTIAATTGTKITYEPGCYITTDELVPVRHQYLSYSSTSASSSDATSYGLIGSYWPGNDIHSNASFTRVDYDVNFAWYAYGPLAYVSTPINGQPFLTGQFSASWTGYLTSPLTVMNATIGIEANGDPFRVTLDGQVIIDLFANSSNPTTATVSFAAGVPVAIEILYSRQHTDGGASTVLQWSLIGSSEDESIARAAAIATDADVAVIVIGENDRTVGEGIDSRTLELPGRQMDLVAAVVATGTPVVAVLMHGRPLVIADLLANVPSVLSAWFPGQAQGTAIAETLVGLVNPGGRSPVTWPYSVGDLPVFYNSKPSARTGCYYTGCIYPNGVIPFGYGLSYTSFNYSNVVLSPSSGVIGPTGVLNITVTVTNTGPVAGDEVPQLYIRDVVSSVTTSSKQLKGFERIFLLPGQSMDVTFYLIAERDLYLTDRSMNRVVEPGIFRFFIGPHSAAADLLEYTTNVPNVILGNFSVSTSNNKPWVVPMGSFDQLYPVDFVPSTW